MKRKLLLSLTAIICLVSTLFLGMDVINASNPGAPGWYVRRDTGACTEYPTSIPGYCVEYGQDFSSSASYSINSCTNEDQVALDCEHAAMAYYGENIIKDSNGNVRLNLTSEFYSVQSFLNGRTFWRSKADCEANNSNTFSAHEDVNSDLYRTAAQYCSLPNFGQTVINLKVGETITLDDVNEILRTYYVSFISGAFTVSRDGNALSINALSEITGAEIAFYKGYANSYYVMCSDTSQNYLKTSALPYRSSKIIVNITKEEAPAPVIEYGYVKIMKVDSSGQPVQGVKFKIGTDLSGDENDTWKYYTTDNNGVITTDRIKVGTTIKYKEETPEEYIPNNTIYSQYIGDATTYTKNITNHIKGKGAFEITKLNQFGEPLEGVVFKIGTDLSGDENGTWKYYTTNSDGKIYVGGIEISADPENPTTYKYQEHSSLDGYVFTDTEKVVRSISIIEANVIEPVRIQNTKIIERSLKVIKRDEASNNPIEGVKFEVHKASDDSLIKELVTDKNGEAYINDITDGEYYIVEKEAPSGYEFSTEKLPFTISEENPNVMISLYNKFNGPKTGLLNVGIIGGITIGIATAVFIIIRKNQRFI